MIPKASATAIEVLSKGFGNTFSLKICLISDFMFIGFWYDLQDGSYQETDVIPTPKVIIDQDSDPNATVVEITFGNRLGALLDTVRLPINFVFSSL